MIIFYLNRPKYFWTAEIERFREYSPKILFSGHLMHTWNVINTGSMSRHFPVLICGMVSSHVEGHNKCAQVQTHKCPKPVVDAHERVLHGYKWGVHTYVREKWSGNG